MPFKSDKQRRFLWSQKPEVAKKIAYANKGKLLTLGDDAADLARRNLDRMKAQKVTSRPTGSMSYAHNQKWADKTPKRNVWGADTVDPNVVRNTLDTATDFIPVVGTGKDLARAAGNVAAGNYGAAAVDAGMAAASVIPGGKVAAKAVKAGADKIRNFHGFERARQRVPDLVPDNPTIWNQINDDVFHGRNLKIGAPAQRGASSSGKSSGTAYNASVMTPDGKELPVLVAPHARDKSKWHLITTRDRGRSNKDTSELGGRMYNKGGNVGGK